MGSRLQQALRSFCFNSDWKYAVFWKLKYRTRMMFTWGDAYYDGNQVEKKWFNPAAGRSIEGPYSHDTLGLAVAKMSYQVYLLGEGVIGKVAVSGKHSWIFSDELDSSSSEYSDGWQTQFSAGIKTIAVVAVIPYGVVQLGSLHKISEDVKLVDHIRNVFSGLQDLLPDCIPISIKSNTENSCQSDTCTKMKGSLHEDGVNLWSQFLSPLGKNVNQSHTFPQIGNFSIKTLQHNMQERAGPSIPGNEISFPSSSVSILSRPPHEAGMETFNTEFSGETRDSGDSGKIQEIMNTSSAKNILIENLNISNSTVLAGSSKMITSDLSLDTQHFENLQLPIKSNRADIHISPFGFCAGYELYEALGPSFQGQKNDSIWEPQKAGTEIAVDISEGIGIGSCSLLTENSDVNLLEAVVARAGSHKGYDTENERSCHESLLTADKTPCKSLDAISSFDQETSCSFNSVTRSVESLRGFLCTSSSIGSEHFGRAHMPVKPMRKRARPGESTRPRPRDRQLIQDRIKELRELVPSGSKCSIDSLLERTIKHMMYLQNITKHAEKLHKCSVSKLLAKETGMRRFSCREQGSSWAVELGNNQKVCPIIVENINMNGQMLIEMLSKESGQFLEIAETIRSLGLTILKGESETYGDQMRLCFIVEAENNRSMHRMDVLWSLMQLLQPKNV